MKQPPIIGITTYARDKRGNFKLGTEYVDAVRRAGGAAARRQDRVERGLFRHLTPERARLATGC